MFSEWLDCVYMCDVCALMLMILLLCAHVLVYILLGDGEKRRGEERREREREGGGKDWLKGCELAHTAYTAFEAFGLG